MKYNGLEVGDKVMCNGFEGRVIVLCDWDDTLIEVRLARGAVCVDASEVEKIED